MVKGNRLNEMSSVKDLLMAKAGCFVTETGTKTKSQLMKEHLMVYNSKADAYCDENNKDDNYRIQLKCSKGAKMYTPEGAWAKYGDDFEKHRIRHPEVPAEILGSHACRIPELR